MSSQRKASEPELASTDKHAQFKKQVKKSISTFYKKNRHPIAYLAQYQLHQEENSILHSPYFLEKEMLTAVTAGNKEDFQKIVKSFLDYSIGQISDTVEKSIEYSAITFLALVSRAAIAGGMEPGLGYNLSDLFLQQIAKCTSVDEYLFIIENIEDTYFNEVIRAKNSLKEPVPLRKAKAYIAKNLSKKLVPEEIAMEACVNKSYLMRLFKKHLDMTITEYIGRSRIDAAAEMLAYSDISIGGIAMYLQFSTQSRFGYLFKKYKGMTPSKYRQAWYTGN